MVYGMSSNSEKHNCTENTGEPSGYSLGSNREERGRGHELLILTSPRSRRGLLEITEQERAINKIRVYLKEKNTIK